MIKPLLLATLFAVCAPTWSQDAAPASNAPATIAEPLYLPAKTTLEEAEAYWKQSGKTITGRGFMALGSGSGADGLGKAFDKNAEILDVQGINFEGIDEARFVFYKGSLYAVQATMMSQYHVGKPRRQYTEQESNAIKDGLLKKYGKPTESLRSVSAKAKKPDVFVWQLQGNKLVFTSNENIASLFYMSPKIEAEMQRNRKEVCKEFNTPGRAICW
jgi:hypothetical protein